MSVEAGQSALESIRAFHEQVDRAVAEVTARLPLRLACGRGCCDCCLDDLTVFPVEAERIEAEAADLLAAAAPAPAGRCAFLDDEGACRIYASRPYVCRTQGLPLFWASGPGQWSRDLCPLSEEPLAAAGLTLADLDPQQCWPLGPFEARLAELQARHSGFADPLPRVALRSLFRTDR